MTTPRLSTIASLHASLNKEANYRSESNRMVGVTVPRKTCSRCGKHKEIPGSTLVNRKFVCKECK